MCARAHCFTIPTTSHAGTLSTEQRAQLLYLSGAAVNAAVEGASAGKESLSRALKLSPHHVAAWTELAEVHAAARDWPAACAALDECLKIGAAGVEALRLYSIILRQMSGAQGGASAAIAFNIQRSIDLAMQAVKADVKDAKSWAILGNAHLSAFFSRAYAAEHLAKAQAAYAQAAAAEATHLALRGCTQQSVAYGSDGRTIVCALASPDLHFNKAQVHAMLEEWEAAIREYTAADAIDPRLGGMVRFAQLHSCTLTRFGSQARVCECA